jgi:hypothetical protein
VEEPGTAPGIDIAEQRDGGVKIVLNGACGYELSFDDEFNTANGLASALIAAAGCRFFGDDRLAVPLEETLEETLE